MGSYHPSQAGTTTKPGFSMFQRVLRTPTPWEKICSATPPLVWFCQRKCPYCDVYCPPAECSHKGNLVTNTGIKSFQVFTVRLVIPPTGGQNLRILVFLTRGNVVRTSKTCPQGLGSYARPMSSIVNSRPSVEPKTRQTPSLATFRAGRTTARFKVLQSIAIASSSLDGQNRS
ncbi:hypothetical protein JTE90_009124 [Oedothorax gibbosus]|uniref:Uncharacterized protein n=1 Tax=Oedothorax gibbosus TaxID=931172 RepID=A0AAV6TCV0_9ARAC|nr:hypothetical protein JTE90_009124 [Oedothorax gibbosus]